MKLARPEDLRSSTWQPPQCTAHRASKPHCCVDAVMKLAQEVGEETGRHVTMYQEVSMYTAPARKSRDARSGRYRAGRCQRIDLLVCCGSKAVAIEVHAGSQHQTQKHTKRLDRLKEIACPVKLLVVHVSRHASVESEWRADFKDALRDLLQL